MDDAKSRNPRAAAARGARVGGAAGVVPSARDALLTQATRSFATKGYAATSTREICEAAGVNIASIHYYFGDKEGLYRAVLLTPIDEMTAAFGAFDDPEIPFEQAMRMLLTPFLAMAGGAHDEMQLHVMRLHLRETLEPSPVFREVVERSIVPVHRSLCALLARECRLKQPDEAIHTLAFAMVAMANDYCMSREFMKLLAPGLLDAPDAFEKALDRLVGYCRALLDHEIAGRSRTAAGKSLKSQVKESLKESLKATLHRAGSKPTKDAAKNLRRTVRR
jgi:TetR/AcrR family transcriptional regulator, regulator of cefoperazone and chloramphenicol sensitivity